MMTYADMNVTNASTILDIFIYGNRITNGVFAGMVLMGFWTIVFLRVGTRDPLNGMLTATFATLLIAVPLWITTLISSAMMTIVILMTLTLGILVYLRQRAED